MGLVPGKRKIGGIFFEMEMKEAVGDGITAVGECSNCNRLHLQCVVIISR